jgi:hypothetical protein
VGLSHSPVITTDGLVLCLDAANVRSYPGSGTSWNDLSGNGNNGTLTNGPTFQNNNSGSILFDGTNDYISGTNSSSIQLSSDFTISAWVKLGNSGSNNESQGIFEKIRTVYNGYGLTRQSNLFKFWTASNNSYTYTVSDSTYFAGNDWYYLVGRRSSGTNRLFINGVLQSSSASPPFSDSGEIYVIGRYYSNVSAFYFTGEIAQVSAYNKALSVNEIKNNYLATKGRFGL